jgi:hypothetical protein
MFRLNEVIFRDIDVVYVIWKILSAIYMNLCLSGLGIKRSAPNPDNLFTQADLNSLNTLIFFGLMQIRKSCICPLI